MGGKRKPKKVASRPTSGNHSVWVCIWTDSGTADVAVPDRSRDGFYLRHIKGLKMDELWALRECLNELKEEADG